MYIKLIIIHIKKRNRDEKKKQLHIHIQTNILNHINVEWAAFCRSACVGAI